MKPRRRSWAAGRYDDRLSGRGHRRFDATLPSGAPDRRPSRHRDLAGVDFLPPSGSAPSCRTPAPTSCEVDAWSCSAPPPTRRGGPPGGWRLERRSDRARPSAVRVALPPSSGTERTLRSSDARSVRWSAAGSGADRPGAASRTRWRSAPTSPCTRPAEPGTPRLRDGATHHFGDGAARRRRVEGRSRTSPRPSTRGPSRRRSLAEPNEDVVPSVRASA